MSYSGIYRNHGDPTHELTTELVTKCPLCTSAGLWSDLVSVGLTNLSS